MQRYFFTVEKDFDGLSLKDFLKIKTKLSDKIISKIKYSLKVNDQKAFTVSTLKYGDKIEITLPKEEPNEYISPLFVPISVLYEDDYIIAINKPCGMLTHNSRSQSVNSLENALCAYFYPTPFVFRPINRLDRDTCGIVLVAKDCISANLFNEQIKKGGYVKKYKALVCGKPNPTYGTINAPIKRESPNDIKRVISPDGRNAVTEYKLEEEINSDLSLVEFTLKTGRTHQIRLHSAHIGCPLYADKLYGEKVNGKTYNLCAYYLKFFHPILNKTITLKCDFDYKI